MGHRWGGSGLYARAKLVKAFSTARRIAYMDEVYELGAVVELKIFENRDHSLHAVPCGHRCGDVSRCILVPILARSAETDADGKLRHSHSLKATAHIYNHRWLPVTTGRALSLMELQTARSNCGSLVQVPLGECPL